MYRKLVQLAIDHRHTTPKQVANLLERAGMGRSQCRIFRRILGAPTVDRDYAEGRCTLAEALRVCREKVVYRKTEER